MERQGLLWCCSLTLGTLTRRQKAVPLIISAAVEKAGVRAQESTHAHTQIGSDTHVHIDTCTSHKSQVAKCHFNTCTQYKPVVTAPAK